MKTTHEPDARLPWHPSGTRPSGKLGYLPGLDGLRAIAVIAVLAYHFRPDHSLLPGGFLGVEVFFVISGYLITALLLEERRSTRRTALGKFWMRRIRRLFAALYATLVTVGLLVAVFHKNEDLARLRGPLFAGATYVSNWQQWFGHVQYAQSEFRAPLGHLWSLAVEEQFYLVWPLLFIGGMFLLGRRFKWLLAGAVVTIWIAMAMDISQRPRFAGKVLAARQQFLVDDWINRIYLNTFMRASGLLLGALLAYFWVPRRLHKATGKNAALYVDAAALVAGAVLVVLVFIAHLNSVWLYVFGFALVDICAVVLIAATVHPLSRVAKVLGSRPLRVVGVRSYGIYLWGVAIFEFTRPGVGFDLHWSGGAVWVFRLLLVGLVTEFSYRVIEQPVRRGVLGRLWRQLRTSNGPHRDQLVLRWQVLGTTLVVVVASLTAATIAANTPKVAQAAPCTGDDVLTNPACLTQTTPLPALTSSTLPGPTTTTKRGATPRTSPPKVSGSGGWAFTAVGDSVMLGAQRPLTDRLTRAVGPTNVNADVGRQGQICLEVLRLLALGGQLAPVVIVHCGNNGTLAPTFVDQVIAITGTVRHVVFLTTKVPRSWEGPNNTIIRDGSKRFGNVKMLDWNFFAVRKPPNFFAHDTYHLAGPGKTLYVDLIYDFLDKQHWL